MALKYYLRALKISEEIGDQNGYKDGYNNIGIIYLNQGNYQEALKKNNLPFDEKLVHYTLHGGMIYEEIEEEIKKMFSGRQKPDAIVTASDRITTSCLTALKAAGMLGPRVP